MKTIGNRKMLLMVFAHFSSGGNHIIIEPADVVLFEGTLVLYFPEIRNLFNMKFFFDTDSGIRLARKCKLII